MFIQNINVTMHYGSQAYKTVIEDMMRRVGTKFDIIVDDDGHTIKQQITSFKTLLSVVRPKGLYVIEDLETSFRPDYHNNNVTTLEYIKTYVEGTVVWDMDNIINKQHP